MHIKTRITELLGIDVPILAFTHCREVVAAVSRAGGMGIYGAAVFSPKRVEADLAWIEKHCDGRPFGVDVMIPFESEGKSMQGTAKEVAGALQKEIPPQHREFVGQLLDRFEVGPLPTPVAESPDQPGGPCWRSEWNNYPLGSVESGAREHTEVALKFPISLLVTALGPPPPDIRDRARALGIKLGALVGSPNHAQRQVAAGVDLIIAQGEEAAAHAGDVSTLVLVPDIVDVVHPIPVLAAGGIGCGRQMAAALALGAEGVWTGSIWLATAESDEPPEVIERLLSAKSTHTVRSNCRTGKSLRQLRSPWSAAWAEPNALPTLPMPLQHLLTAEAEERIHRNHRADLTTIPVGQIVGRMNAVRSVADVMRDMTAEYLQAVERLNKLQRGGS